MSIEAFIYSLISFLFSFYLIKRTTNTRQYDSINLRNDIAEFYRFLCAKRKPPFIHMIQGPYKIWFICAGATCICSLVVSWPWRRQHRLTILTSPNTTSQCNKTPRRAIRVIGCQSAKQGKFLCRNELGM